MEKQLKGMEQSRFVPEPAESFEIDFLNSKANEIRQSMLEMGGFIFSRSGTAKEGEVYFKGERNDGTKITIIIEKGGEYKTPGEKVKEENEAENTN